MIGPTADEGDVSGEFAKGDVDALLQAGCQLDAAQLALLGFGHVGIDRPQGILGGLKAAAQIDQQILHLAGQGNGESLTQQRGKDFADRRRSLGDRNDDLGVLQNALQSDGEVGEPSASDLDADRVAHDVFELVGLVDHHHIVLGQDRPRAAYVEAVEVEVDHDHIGGRSPVAGTFG